MNQHTLQSRRALVTGAAGGIGAAIALDLARSGADLVVLHDRPGSDLGPVAEEVRAAGATSTTIEADLADVGSVEGIVRSVLDAGGIDLLVNTAAAHEKAMTTDSDTLGLDVELWDLVMAVNVRAPWLLARGLAPSMASSPSAAVVNVASQHGIVAAEASPAYNSSKAALIHLTKSMALDLRHLGIRVNAVAPGVVDTPMVDRIFDLTPDPAATRAAALDTYIIERFGDPVDIARAVTFLGSELSSWTTGACLVVDGGQTAWR